jgi:hypothetical protein
MTVAETRLRNDRAQRRVARQLFDADLAQIKADLSARGIGGRIKHSVIQKADEAVISGIAVVNENKPIVAGTIALLLVWLLRNPLGKLVGRLFGHSPETDHVDDQDVWSDEE